MAKNQHFRPCRKNCVGSKNDCQLFELSRRSLSACKVWGDRTTRAGCRSENWCFCMSRLVCLRVGDSSNKYCVTIYGSILMWFSALFLEWMVLSYALHIILSFVDRWRHSFREIAVKNCKKSKNRRKSLCVPFRIDS